MADPLEPDLLSFAFAYRYNPFEDRRKDYCYDE
jgi:hypothetical protein